MCKYCKHNNVDREDFKNAIWNDTLDIEYVLDYANISTYINDNELVPIYFDDGEGIEQESRSIVACPICGEKL